MTSLENKSTDSSFDAKAKEEALKNESEQWDTSKPEDAKADDIPVIDLEAYFTSGEDRELEIVAEQLRTACEETGFYSIVGHQISRVDITETFDQIRQFHSLSIDSKNEVLMDRPDWPVGGMGYLPFKNRKLPARDTGNLNEAFILKCDDKLGMDDNQWPDASSLPEFRAVVERYAGQMEMLGKRMLPIYARALGVEKDFFKEAFDTPLYRLRMTHYPATEPTTEYDPKNGYGISPHVDTSFCTILAQDNPGLTVFSERRKVWVNAPVVDGGFIVNTGELLKHWSNDRFLSTRHFANNNTGTDSRYSIPFFFNANPHYVMSCIPSCCSKDNPAKYPPISYAQSQGVVQGE